jgi:hypothetical protein
MAAKRGSKFSREQSSTGCRCKIDPANPDIMFAGVGFRRKGWEIARRGQ